MTKKLFLTSVIAICVAIPAFATPTNTGTFPNNGLMQPDYTYTNAATSTNMDGVYEGDVDAVPQYTDDEYTVTAGNYLPANSESLATCTAGNFCPGLQNTVHYHATNNQGLETCPSGYDNSATGSTANTDCYRACVNSDITHATGITGNVYYNGTDGDGTKACTPTACENGWHVKPGLNLSTTIGNGAGENIAYVSGSGSFSQQKFGGGTDRAQSFYGITENNTWAVYYDSTHGMVTGAGRCSKVFGTGSLNGASSASDITTHTTAELGAEGGRYCYCNVTGYTPAGGTLQSLSSPWVFNSDNNDAGNCASNCAGRCAGYMRNDVSSVLLFRAALLGSVGASPASCEANTITINWTGTTQAAIDANNAGTATYGGDIRTPQSASHVPGKTFTGWLFSAPSGD